MKMMILIVGLLLFGYHEANTFSEGQNQTNPPNDTTRSEPNDTINSHGPRSIVRSILQDRKGNIWMATWEGVFRYDARQQDGQLQSFTNITSKVSSARFFSLLEDRSGNFWFGTIGSGVYYYDGKSFKNFTTTDGLIGNEIVTIYEDKAGNIWLGGSGGASRYDGKSFRNYTVNGEVMEEDRLVRPFYERQPQGVNTIIEDRTGKLWFGTSGNTFIYDGKTFTRLTSKDGNTFRNVWSITGDRKGNIWFGANDGVWRYKSGTFTKFSEKAASAILEDKKGNIWTSSTTAMYGKPWTLSRYDEQSLYHEKPTVTEITNKQLLFGILEDDDGNIWFASGHGVYRYDGKTITDFKDQKGDH